MNVSAIPDIVPSAEIAPAGVATADGASGLPAGLDFAALFLAALGLSATPSLPAVQSPSEATGETPSPDEANGTDTVGDATVLGAAAAALASGVPVAAPTPATAAVAEQGGAAAVPASLPSGEQAAATPAPPVELAPTDGATDAPPAGDTDAAPATSAPEPSPTDVVEGASEAVAAETAPASAADVQAAAAESTSATEETATEVKPGGRHDGAHAGARGAEQREEVSDGRGRERTAAAASSEAPAAPVPADGERAGLGHHDGGGELGRRETVEATRSGGGPDPSAPSPLPHPSRETVRVDPGVRHERLPSTLPQEVERIIRLDALRAGPPDNGELRLELATDGLGRVDVRVAVRADAVHASLLASHDQARDALEAHRPSLEAALGRSNLRLEGFSVALGQQGRDGADLRERMEGPPTARPLSVGAVSAPSVEPTRAILTPGGLSLRA